MSIGLARLRGEPERIRQGAIDKGEDPTIVDSALALYAAAPPPTVPRSRLSARLPPMPERRSRSWTRT